MPSRYIILIKFIDFGNATYTNIFV